MWVKFWKFQFSISLCGDPTEKPHNDITYQQCNWEYQIYAWSSLVILMWKCGNIITCSATIKTIFRKNGEERGIFQFSLSLRRVSQQYMKKYREKKEKNKFKANRRIQWSKNLYEKFQICTIYDWRFWVDQQQHKKVLISLKKVRKTRFHVATGKLLLYVKEEDTSYYIPSSKLTNKKPNIRSSIKLLLVHLTQDTSCGDHVKKANDNSRILSTQIPHRIGWIR